MRKVQILRWWLLAVFCLAAAVLFRDACWGLLPIAFFTGQAGCFCCIDDCTNCTAGTRSDSMQVVISGVTDDSCGDCEQLNDTFVCTYTGVGGSPLFACTWEYIFDPDICTYTQMWIFLGSEFPVGLTFYVAVADTNPITTSETESIVFKNTVGGTSVNCQFSSYSVAYNSRTGNDCVGASATCSVTAL